MGKKLKFRRPPLSTGMSPIPCMYGLRSYVENYNTLVMEVPKRIERGRQLVLLQAANVLRKKVQALAPDLPQGDSKYDYSRHLKVALLDGTDDDNAVALYFDDISAEFTQDAQGRTTLFYRRLPNSPDWVDVLIKYGPWPADMVPVKLRGGNAKIISRNARQDELDALSGRLLRSRGVIESEFRRAGIEGKIKRGGSLAVGSTVHVDVGYNVLRSEFGLDDEKQQAHWRPAFLALKDEMPSIMRSFVKYIETGSEAWFSDLPREDDERLKMNRFLEGVEFQKKLEPFAPR